MHGETNEDLHIKRRFLVSNLSKFSRVAECYHDSKPYNLTTICVVVLELLYTA
jgi:hypothetical protein